MPDNWINQPEDDTEEQSAAYEGVVFLPPDELLYKKVAFRTPIVDSSQHKRVALKALLQGRLAAHYQEPSGFSPFGLRDSGRYSHGYSGFGAVHIVSCDPAEWESWREAQDAKRHVISPDQKRAQKQYYCAFIEASIDPGPVEQQLVHQPKFPPVEEASPNVGVAQLQAKVRFLEAQLRADMPYLRLYKFGGISLLVAIVSLIGWAITGIGVPFHPLFAAMVIPAAIGVIVMAFYLRREAHNPAP